MRRALALVVLLSPALARADRGELAGGVEAGTAVWPPKGRAAAVGQLGLTDFFAARLELGVELGAASAGRAGLHLAYAWDVITWVPEASLGAVGAHDGDALWWRGAARLQLRRFISPSTSIAGAIVGELGSDWAVALVLAAWLHDA